MFLKKQRPAAILVLIFIALVSAIVFHPWTDKYNDGLITWDKLGYYLYLPNLFIYNDWHQFEFAKHIFETYQPSATWYQTLSLPNGDQFITYPTGLAYFQLPFFLGAHVWAFLFDFPADGFSLPYVFAVYLSGVFFVVFGLYLSFKTLQRFFTSRQALAFVIILLLSTNLFFYGMVDNIMPHSYSFFLFSVLLYYTIRWHEQPHFRFALIIFLALGFIVSIRVTDVIAVIIPALYNIYSLKSFREKLLLIRNNIGSLFLAGIIGLIPFAVQLGYWRFATGEWFFNAYSFTDLGFSWDLPEVSNVLYSYRKGWLIYTPVMILSVLGFAFMKRARALILGIFLFLIIHVYVLSSWQIWWFGGSFGQRSMVQAYAFLLIPLAFGINALRKVPVLNIIIILFISGSILLNLLHTWQYKNSLILVDLMTKDMYKESITHPFHYYIPKSKRNDRQQWKQEFIASDETIFEDTNIRVITRGQFIDLIDMKGPEARSLPYKWLRCSFESRFTPDHQLFSENLQLVNEVKNNTAMRFLKSMATTDRFADIYTWSEWKADTVDFRVPTDIRDDDRFMIYFYLPETKEAGIKNIRISGLKIKK